MRKVIFFLIVVFTSLLVWINIKLYSTHFTNIEKQKDVVLQLNFIETELKSNQLGKRMQAIFPEGFVFTNVLYGLSWCELAISDSTQNKQLKKKAIEEAIFAYNEINSEKSKSIFDASLTPSYGIFFVGWKNYLLSKILLVDSSFKEVKQYKFDFIEHCDLINEALAQSSTPFLQSYQNQSWPADMFVAMASLKNHDLIFKPKYENKIKNWVQQVQTKLDTSTKMIAHKVNANTGETIEGTRGSSISLILRFLAEIDYGFAKEQYVLYKNSFVTSTFGLPSISEYPKGQIGTADVDSGPVIFGVGFSGTIVSIGTFAKFEDTELAEQQYKTIHAFGFSTTYNKRKKYVFGFMPIADAFIAWGRATELAKFKLVDKNSDWRVKFHLFSFGLLFVFWLLYFQKKIFKKVINFYKSVNTF